MNNSDVFAENAVKTDYYTSTRQKVEDFALGLLGGVAGSIVLSTSWLVVIALFLGIVEESGPLDSVLVVLGTILVAALYVKLSIIFFRKGRGYIAIGILFSLLIPLFVSGSCLVAINRWSEHPIY